MSRYKKISYDVDDTDVFSLPISWPDIFLADPAYALLRPLHEKTSPWRKSHDALSLYFYSQARRLGGRHHLLFHLSNLALISKRFTYLTTFLVEPFNNKFNLSQIFNEMDEFLLWRFINFQDDPWKDYPLKEKSRTKKRIRDQDLEAVPIELTEQERKKLLKKLLSKIPWQQQLQKSLESSIEEYHSELIETALKECPSLVQRENLDTAHQIFSSPTPEMFVELDDDYVVTDVPVMLGSHYLEKNTYKHWFGNKKFYRILGNYARWDDAKITIFKKDKCSFSDGKININPMLSMIRNKYNLRSVGNIKQAQVDGEDYFLSLLVDSGIPERSLLVSEWEINCPNLIILSKDTEV